MLKLSHMKLIELMPEEFDRLAITEPNANFYQTSSWANFYSNLGYSPLYIGYCDDNNMYSAFAMLLVKNGSFLLSKKTAICPGGFLTNYHDDEALNNFAKDLRKYLSKKGIKELVIRPNINFLTRKGNNELLISNLKELGYEKTNNSLSYSVHIDEIPSYEDIEDVFLKAYVVEDNFEKLFKINSNYKNINMYMNKYAKFVVCELDLDRSISSLRASIVELETFVEMHQDEFKYANEVKSKKEIIAQKQSIFVLLNNLSKENDHNPILAITCLIEYNKKITQLFVDDRKEYRVLNTLDLLNEKTQKTISQAGYKYFDVLQENNSTTTTEQIGEFTLRV